MNPAQDEAPKDRPAQASAPAGQAPAAPALPPGPEPQAASVNQDQARVLPAAPAAEVRTVAIVGEVAFAGLGLIRAALALGLEVRVLCREESTEASVRSALAGRAGATPSAPSSQPTFLQGSLSAPGKLQELFSGAQAFAFLSPVGMGGRTWQERGHAEDLQGALSAAREAGVGQVAYLSALSADPESPCAGLREAAQAEKWVASSGLQAHIFRAAPLMGPGDGWLTRMAEEAGRATPVVLLWGYGDTLVQPLHVDDLGRCLARSFVRQAEELPAGLYVLAGGETFTLLDLWDLALEKEGRFKFKLHIPLFVLRLLACLSRPGAGKSGVPVAQGAASGAASFRERVGLLNELFATERNDAPKLLGLHEKLKEASKTLAEFRGLPEKMTA